MDIYAIVDLKMFYGIKNMMVKKAGLQPIAHTVK